MTAAPQPPGPAAPGVLPVPGLVGRGPELAFLTALVTRTRAGDGAAVVLRGAPGLGKSALLAAVRERAQADRFRVLSCTGVPAETRLPFAGLLQLLRPLLDAVDRLGRLQRSALLGGLGLHGATTTEPLVLANAVVELLTGLAGECPLLVVADDAQWLDRPTTEVLTFLGRRLDGQAVALAAAVRDTEERGDLLDGAALPELRLGPLTRRDAEALLAVRAPDLPPEVREWVLTEAEGNPLALLELPLALAGTAGSAADWSPPSGGGLPRVLPLTARLERAFAARAGDLPPGARSALLTAALDDGDQLGEVLAAATDAHGAPVTTADVELVVRAGLVDVDEACLSVRFRHPLMRSAVHQTAGIAARHAVHAALARLLADDPDRAAWHRAACCVAPDEEVAAALERAADRARARGALGTAVAGLERAARLTPDPSGAGTRLLTAAEVEFEGGHQAAGVRLLERAARLPLSPPDRNRLLWLRELYDGGGWSGSERIRAFADTAERMWQSGETDRALDLLVSVGMRCYWSATDPAASARVAAVAERLENGGGDGGDDGGEDVRLPAILALAVPVRHGAEARGRLRALAATQLPAKDRSLLAGAASAVGDAPLADRVLAGAVSVLRAEGRPGSLVEALVHQAWAGVLVGASGRALSAAREAAAAAEQLGMGRWRAAAEAAQAICLARAGDVAAAVAAADRAEAHLPQAEGDPLLAVVVLARGAAGLAAGRPLEAMTELLRISDASEPAYNPNAREWGLVDLAEAAALANRPQAVADLVAALTEEVAVSGSPLLRAGLAFAVPVLAQDLDGVEAALAGDLSDWPLTRARLLLVQGTLLRRRRRQAAARQTLRAAEAAFTALGATAWADQARAQLGARLPRPRRGVPSSSGVLTAQELEVASLAATGLTNQEIAQRLFLSPRTVSTHLYRAFPKLQITSRADLRGALGR